VTFHDDLFPIDIAFNSEGGPTRRTDIVTLVSGKEERNSPHAGSRRAFNAGYGVKSMADIERVIAFFEARRGRLHAFRFRDPFDWKSCPLAQAPQADDQLLGTGDGANAAFQLVKAYDSGGARTLRTITKPVQGSILAPSTARRRALPPIMRPASSPSRARPPPAPSSPRASFSTRRRASTPMRSASISPPSAPGTFRPSRSSRSCDARLPRTTGAPPPILSPLSRLSKREMGSESPLHGVRSCALLIPSSRRILRAA